MSGNEDKKKDDNENESFLETLSKLTGYGVAKSLEAVRFLEKTTHEVENKFKELKDIRHTVDHELKKTSADLNKQYEYPCMLVRTHGTAFVAMSTFFVGYPSLYVGRRFFMYSATSTFIASSAFVKLVKYEYESE